MDEGVVSQSIDSFWGKSLLHEWLSFRNFCFEYVFNLMYFFNQDASFPVQRNVTNMRNLKIRRMVWKHSSNSDRCVLCMLSVVIACLSTFCLF